MKQTLKLGIGAAAFALAFAGAVIAYNTLGKQESVQNDNRIAESGSAESASNAENGQENPKAPDFSMLDQSGNNVTLSAMIGKPVVLNFWASWCPPCKSEMPEFDKVYAELGSEIQFMMVDLVDGRRETVEKGVQYIEEQGFSFPVYFDIRQEGAYAYGIRSIPTTLFIDRDGYIVTGVQGAINESTLRKGIALIKPVSNN